MYFVYFSALPVFSKVPQNQVVSIGKSAVLDCKASGSSNVKVKWLKDGHPFTVEDINTRIFVFTTSIFIKEVRYSDAGIFTCQATNEAGSVKAEAKIRILGKKIPRKFITKVFIHCMLLTRFGGLVWNKKYLVDIIQNGNIRAYFFGHLLKTVELVEDRIPFLWCHPAQMANQVCSMHRKGSVFTILATLFCNF